MITVLFFASLRDQLGSDKQLINIESLAQFIASNGTPTEAFNSDQLIAFLCQNNPNWQSVFSEQKLFIAVNQEIVQAPCPIADGDEVAFFPPVTGG
ncbi:MoaD/ThiS family protein [Halioxenophilus aromaticivorans]|uniref:Molybdopterin synthase sulfur carrier subunit n=1 Tax=Halioxenophilus aromaticivorans TaxID=1306992 RepID=A0AAV3TYT0_9ALTE